MMERTTTTMVMMMMMSSKALNGSASSGAAALSVILLNGIIHSIIHSQTYQQLGFVCARSVGVVLYTQPDIRPLSDAIFEGVSVPLLAVFIHMASTTTTIPTTTTSTTPTPASMHHGRFRMSRPVNAVLLQYFAVWLVDEFIFFIDRLRLVVLKHVDMSIFMSASIRV